MKVITLITLCLFSLYLCVPENPNNVQKALLVKTDLTKEQLTQLLNTESLSKLGTNNNSVEEVSPDLESETESDTEKLFKNLKNGKLKIKVKLELDLKDKKKKHTETETESEGESEDEPVAQISFVQTSSSQIPKKVSIFNYILALLIMFFFVALFVLATTSKKNRKYILNKIKKNDDYLLENN